MTQTPKDVPADVLVQLGHRVQHALRAFTPDDERALRATANTFPRSPLRRPRAGVEPTTVAEQIGKALGSPAGRTLQRELVRGLFGVLGIRAATRRRRSGW